MQKERDFGLLPSHWMKFKKAVSKRMPHSFLSCLDQCQNFLKSISEPHLQQGRCLQKKFDACLSTRSQRFKINLSETRHSKFLEVLFRRYVEGWIFGWASAWNAASRVAVMEPECHVCSQLRFPADTDPGKQQRMAQEVGSLSSTSETQIEFPAPGFGLASPHP